MRLAFAGRFARQEVTDALTAIAGLEVIEAGSNAALADLADEVDAMVVSDPRGAEGEMLAAALRQAEARVRWIQIVSAGYSGLLSHPLPENLAVTNQGGASAPAVAEHALALMLAHCRRLPSALAAQSARQWESAAFRGTLATLEGSTVAILGLGHVGNALARRLEPFGATCIGVTRDGSPRDGVSRTFALAALGEVLPMADSVVCCLPASPETRRLLDAERMAAMKPQALLVNVGRGEIIDTQALAEALISGHLGGAALDVADPEPLPDDHLLWRAPNLIVTPHVAGGGSPLTGRRIAQIVTENARRFLRGEPLLNQVHPRREHEDNRH